MCGIAGAYQQVDGDQAVSRMSDCLSHRGPDEQGSYSFVNETVSVYLAHRRLSIIDLAGGQQPFVKHHLALTYNGELYNYRELRAELVASGSSFLTSSDTEVVLEAWRRWGPAVCGSSGACSPLPCSTNRLAPCSSPGTNFGIKPLHYILRKDGVVFSSELKALVAAFGRELRDRAGPQWSPPCSTTGCRTSAAR